MRKRFDGSKRQKIDLGYYPTMHHITSSMPTREDLETRARNEVAMTRKAFLMASGSEEALEQRIRQSFDNISAQERQSLIEQWRRCNGLTKKKNRRREGCLIPIIVIGLTLAVIALQLIVAK